MDIIEVKNCIDGVANPITKEIWCNKYNEFCKFIAKCIVKERKSSNEN